MFGTSHLYVFINPEEVETEKVKEKEEITYEMAQKEIAKHSGLNVQNKSSPTGTNANGEDEEETLGKIKDLLSFFFISCFNTVVFL